MKLHLNNSQNNNIGKYMPAHNYERKKQEEFLKITDKKDYHTQRPAQAISFGGSAVSWVDKFVKSNKANKIVSFVYDNEAAYNAIYSLIIAGILKPAAVLNMPGSEDKDKQIVATKNFLQAFIGSILGLTVGGGFIKKSVDVVKNNLKLIDSIDDNNKIKTIAADSEKALELARQTLIKENKGLGAKFKNATQNFGKEQGFNKVKGFISGLKSDIKYSPTIDEITSKAKSLVENFEKGHLRIFEKNPEYLNLIKSGLKDAKSGTSYADAFEVFWKNSTGALTAIGKAKISSILLPTVMAFLFAKKNAEKEQMEKAKQGTLTQNTSFKNEQEQFQKMLNKNNNQVNFKGNILNSSIDNLAKGIESLGMTKAGSSLSKLLAKTKKPSARMSDIESFMITGYWLQNTARSKKIEDSQKLGLNVHTALVTAVSSTAAFVIDAALDGLITKAKGSYGGAIKKAVEETKNIHKDLISQSTDSFKIANATPAAKMAIKEACLNLWESGKADKDAVSNIIKSLESTEAIKQAKQGGLVLDEKLITNTIESLKKTEPIRNTLKDKTSELLSSSTIAKKLSQIDLNDAKAIEKEINSLSSAYGKKLSKFKSLTVFTLVVRFLVPVLMVPFSGKLKKKIVELTSKKNKEQEVKQA